MALNHRIDFLNVLDGAVHKEGRKLDDRLRLVVIHEEIRSDLIDRVPRDVPLEQHLQSIFSRFSSRSHFLNALSDLPKDINHL
jgi:hypothetical protein